MTNEEILETFDCSADATPGAMRAASWLLDCARLLLKKNKAYGDSALQPLSLFGDVPASLGIKVRITDKFSRIARGDPKARLAIPEDTKMDIVNYFALLHEAERQENK